MVVLTKSTIVSSLVLLIMLLDKVTCNLETKNFNQNDLDELKKYINSTALTKFFDISDMSDVEPCAVEILNSFKSLRQQLKGLLEVDATLLELKTLSEQLANCLGKEQCLSEASRLVKELGYQKNLNASLVLTLKTTELDYKKEKAIVQTSTVIFTQQKKILLAKRRSLEDQLSQAQQRITLFGNQLIQAHDRVQFLEAKLSHVQKQMDEGVRIIKTANNDIENDTMAYNYLEAEAAVYKAKVNYYKLLSEEAMAITPKREGHAMTLEDKVSQKIRADTSHLDSLFITAANASARFDRVHANFLANPNRETQNQDDVEDPELMEALRLSVQDVIPVGQDSVEAVLQVQTATHNVEDPELEEVLKLSTHDVGSVHHKSPDVEDPDLEEVLKLSTQDFGPINSQENQITQTLDPLNNQQEED